MRRASKPLYCTRESLYLSQLVWHSLAEPSPLSRLPSGHVRFYVDHIIDTSGTMFLILGSRFRIMTERVAAAVLIVFLMLAINSDLGAHTLGIFKISHGKLGPTENPFSSHDRQLFLIHGAHSRIFGHRFLLFDIGGAVSILVMGNDAGFLVH